MRAAGRHTVPPGDPQAGPTARPTRILPCRPDKHRPPCDQPYLAAPATAARHATSLTLQPRQLPSTMRPAHLADPATAVRPSCRPSPYRPNRCRTAQAVLTRSRRLFHGPAAPPQPKGAEGTAERARSWQGGVAEGRGSRGKGLQREGVAEGRGRGGEGCNRKARSRIRQGPAGSPTEFFAGFVPFASLNIRFERVQTASQPYFYSRKRFTPRPHTHQIQPVAAPRQRSAPAGGSRDRHPLRLEDSLPFRPSVRHPETHGSGCRFVGS